jgi:hypothetical protein
LSDPLLGSSAPDFAGQAAQPDADAAETATDKQSGLDKRIGQFRAKLGDAERINADLTRKVAELEGRVAAVTQPQPAAGSEDFKDHRDLSGMEWAQLLQESGSDPATVARAIDAMAEKKARAVMEEFKGSQAAEQQDRKKVQAMLGYLNQVYGQDLHDPQSALRQRAETVSQTLAQEYGADRFSNDPVSVLAAYAEAGRQVHSEKITTMEQELEQLRDRVKRSEAMNRTVDAAAELNEESKEALKNKDPGAALRNLRITRALTGLE